MKKKQKTIDKVMIEIFLVIATIVLIIIIGNLIFHKQTNALQELKIQCDEKYGINNYTITMIDSVCCEPKGINHPPIINNITFG